jgi:hypothetical protein
MKEKRGEKREGGNEMKVQEGEILTSPAGAQEAGPWAAIGSEGSPPQLFSRRPTALGRDRFFGISWNFGWMQRDCLDNGTLQRQTWWGREQQEMTISQGYLSSLLVFSVSTELVEARETLFGSYPLSLVCYGFSGLACLRTPRVPRCTPLCGVCYHWRRWCDRDPSLTGFRSPTTERRAAPRTGLQQIFLCMQPPP